MFLIFRKTTGEYFISYFILISYYYLTFALDTFSVRGIVGMKVRLEAQPKYGNRGDISQLGGSHWLAK